MVYEAVGRASTVTAALERVDIGGTVVVLGVASPADVGTLSPFDVWARQLTVTGAWGVETTFGSALALLEPLGVERLATHDLPLAEIEEALRLARAGGSGKVLLVGDPTLAEETS